MKSNLPAGWHWGKVSDLYDAVKSTVDPTVSDALPYIGLEHLSKGGGIESIGNSEDLKSIKTAFQAGDVLYGKLRPYLNKHAVVDFEGVCSTDILAFRSKYGYASHFLNHYFGLPSVIQYANEHSKGINLPRVNAGALLDMDMPIPPVNEAKRIVAQLEATMQKLEASQERLEKLPLLLKKFRQAVLAAAVSGKLTEAWRAEQPQGSETGVDLLDRIRTERRAQWEAKQIAKMKGRQLSLNDSWRQKYEEPAAPDTSELPELPEEWVYATFEQISERVTVGFVGSMKNEYVEEGIPFLRSQNVRANRFNPEGLIYISPEFHDTISKSTLEPGDLVVVRSGSVGTACVIPDSLPEANCSDLVIVKQPKVLPDFCSYFMNSAAKTQVSSQTVGIALSHFNTKAMARMPLPVPPFEEQLEIVRQVKHYFELADQLEARFEQAAALVEQLPQALLAKAFSGQLVPQDPNDEPASALLERLEAEVAAPVKGKRGRKPKAMADAPLFAV